MSLKHWAGENGDHQSEFELEAEPELEAEVAQALQHFRASVNAWSEAAFHQAALNHPRTVASESQSGAANWRLAAGWALGCVLALGSLSGAIYEHQHRQNLARIAAQKAAAQKPPQQPAAVEQVSSPAVRPDAPQRKAAEVVPAKENAGSEDETLLANVDTDISQQVPAAMEPLARLMDDNGTQ